MMGGIVTDLAGRSTVPGLFAVGESACTGLHGANRLASNSLSECFVFGARAARAGLDEPALSADAADPPQPRPVAAPTEATREAMWRHAGLERTPEGLRELQGDPHPLARLVATCALAREESRGAHRRTDFPGLSRSLSGTHTVLSAAGAVALESWS
jgi:L-aspartate oxidase